jgi:predicted MFS family arabinose efflux permease
LFGEPRETALVVAGMGLIAGTYGLVRLAYGLFLPDVQASLSMTSAVAGYVSSGASAAYCVGALCGLTAAERSRRLVLGALLTASLGSVGMALAPSLWLFAAAAILGSTGAGLASPGLVAVLQHNVPVPRRDRAQAVVNAGTGPGLVAAGLLALLLLPQWRLGFAIGGVLTAAMGVGVLLLDRSRHEPDPAVAAPPAGRTEPKGTAGALRLLGTPATAALLLGAASAVVWTYGRTQLVAQGASDTGSTLAWIALGAGGTASALTSALLSGLHPARAWLLTAGSVGAATAVLGLGAGDPVVALAACGVFGWGFVAATSALIAWTAHLAPDHAAPGTSLLFVTLVVGQAAGSAAAGSIAGRYGLPPAFLVAAAAALLAASCGQRGVRAPLRPATTPAAG